MKKTLLFLFAAAFFPLAAFAQDTAYVQSVKARIMKEPSFKSTEVATAKKGDKLAVIQKGDGWLKVSTGSAEGWISELTISSAPPMDKVAVITDESEDIGSKSRKRASTMTSAAASRGLTDTERKRLGEAGGTDYRSLREVEKIASGVTDKDLDNFMQPGEK